MKRKLFSSLSALLLSAGCLSYSSTAQAATYNWNFSTSTSPCYASGACNQSSGSYGNVRTAGSQQNNDFKVQANAYGFTGTGSSARTAWLGQYSGGLGVTNRNESGSGSTHTADNNGANEFVVFKFDQSIELTGYSLTNFSTTDSTPDTMWYLGTSTTPLDFTGKTLANLTSSLTGVSSGSAVGSNVNVGAGHFGNYLILAANFYQSNDSFKIKTLTVNHTAPPPPGGGDPVPEPGTMVLLGTGLAALGFVARRKSHKAGPSSTKL